LPDLVIVAVRLEQESGEDCYSPPFHLGVRVYVHNIGNATAGAFVLAVNEIQQVVGEGLAAGQQTSRWFDAIGISTVAMVDATFLIVEQDENNNQFVAQLPTPTLPVPCTPTAP
jgi:hypothetical protein